MNIYVHTTNKDESFVALQIFDFLFAYKQHQNRENNFYVPYNIEIGNQLPFGEPDTLHIGFFSKPEGNIDISNFDFAIVDANVHQLEVATQGMYQSVINNDNCYWTTGAFVSKSHPLKHKLIFSPNYMVTRDMYARAIFYPYFEPTPSIEERRKEKRKAIAWINGQDRPHRRYFLEKLKDQCKEKIFYRDTIWKMSSQLLDAPVESFDDTKFRNLVNSMYPVVDNTHELEQTYYSQKHPIGIKGQFGSFGIGHQVLNEYRTHNCIIFPESTWINDEILVTEKILKCFVSKTIPWPIGGALTDVLYNELGYKTAWNLLPDPLKSYTYETNHQARVKKCVEAIDWLANNSDLLTSEQAFNILENNYNLMFTNKHDIIGVEYLDSLIKKYAKT